MSYTHALATVIIRRFGFCERARHTANWARLSIVEVRQKENCADYRLNASNPQGDKLLEPRFGEARFHRLLDALLTGYDAHVRPVVRASALA